MRLHQLLCICALVILAGCSRTGVPLSLSRVAHEADLKVLPDFNDYIDDGAVIILDHRTDRFAYNKFRLVPKRTEHSIIMYASERGNRWLTPAIRLDHGDELESFHARTILPGGKSVELSMTDLTPLHSAPDRGEFMKSRSLGFTFRDVVPGAILEYAYSVRSADEFSMIVVWDIDHAIPCLRSRYSLQIPENMSRGEDLQWLARDRSLDLTPVMKWRISDTGPNMLYLDWVLSDLPALVHEPCMPPPDEVRRYAVIGLKPKSWTDYVEWYLSQVGSGHDASGEIVDLAREINMDRLVKREKIRNVYNYTQRNYRYVDVDMGDSGIVPNQIEDIVERKYGDCKDMTALNIALLTGLRVTAYPALVDWRVRRELNANIASPRFDHLLTYAKDDQGNEFWLDSSAGMCPLGIVNPNLTRVPALVIKPDGGFFIKRIPANGRESCAIDRTVHVDIDGQGQLSGFVKVRYSGLQAMILRNRFGSITGSNLQDAVLGQLGVNDLQLEIHDFRCGDMREISDSLHVDFNWSIRNRDKSVGQCAIPAEFLRLWDPLPDFDPVIRHNPVRLPYPILIRDVMELDWSGTNYELSAPPTSPALEYGFGSLACAMTWIGTEGIVRHTQLHINDITIGRDGFESFANLCTAIAQLNKETIVLTAE
ncbi:MAG: DUF3857 domain-containing protein [bacterium]|nr:DUF3857 domain-containing protein [bacterium]